MPRVSTDEARRLNDATNQAATDRNELLHTNKQAAIINAEARAVIWCNSQLYRLAAAQRE